MQLRLDETRDSSSCSWVEVFIGGRWGWMNEDKLLSIVHRDGWVVEINNVTMGHAKTKDEAFVLARKIMEEKK